MMESSRQVSPVQTVKTGTNCMMAIGGFAILVTTLTMQVNQMKFEPGTKVRHLEFTGVVVDNVKLPGDICVEWENGQLISYDEETAEAFLEIIN